MQKIYLKPIGPISMIKKNKSNDIKEIFKLFFLRTNIAHFYSLFYFFVVLIFLGGYSRKYIVC